MAYNIFLSYSSNDKDWTKYISDEVKKFGIEPYLSEYDRKPGKYLKDKIERAIQDCDAFVVLLTHNSQFSPYVNQEIGFAEGKKPIIPLVEKGVKEENLAMLKGREYIPFDSHKSEEVIPNLLSYLKRQEKLEEKDAQSVLIWTGVILLLIIIAFWNK